MNKHELKSLLENIYSALTEDDWYNDPPPSTPKPSTTPYVLPNPWWQPPKPPTTPPKPVYPPWPTDPEDVRSHMRHLMIDDYYGWLEDMERDPKWWSDRYGFDVLEWWRSLNPGPGYIPGGDSG
jgi:hypothetical protein